MTDQHSLTQQVKAHTADDRGALSLWILMMLPFLVFLAGVTYDAGSMFTAYRESNNIAGSAARAGAQVIDNSSVLVDGVARIDTAVAFERARGIAEAQGATVDSLTTPRADQVTVVVSRKVQPLFLDYFGVGEQTVVASSTARVRVAIQEDDFDVSEALNK